MQLHTLISLLPRSTAALFSHHLVTVAFKPNGEPLSLRKNNCSTSRTKNPAQSKLLPFNAIRSDVQKNAPSTSFHTFATANKETF